MNIQFSVTALNPLTANHNFKFYFFLYTQNFLLENTVNDAINEEELDFQIRCCRHWEVSKNTELC